MDDITLFNQKGFVLKKKLFTRQEIEKLKQQIDSDLNKISVAPAGEDLSQTLYNFQSQSSTGKLSLTFWNHPSDDLYSKFSTNERIVKPMQEFLKDEVYHYHSKIVWKKPGEGGFDWHQDYGYWYHNACLFPDMGSCFIMIDKSTKENGCLKVLSGSHHAGRMDHHQDSREQTGDSERIKELEKRLECVYIEADPGDALFFHCNLLHSSDRNNTNGSRRVLISCFNTKKNNPYKEIAHASYTPLNISKYNSILEY